MSPLVKLSPFQNNAKGATYLNDLSYDRIGRLTARVSGTSDQIMDKLYRYEFEEGGLRGFLLLDEGDLIAIWEPGEYSPNISPIYEVIQGSIFEGMSKRPGIMSVSLPFEELEECREYLIATDDECIIVLSSKPPRITEITHAEQDTAGNLLDAQ